MFWDCPPVQIPSIVACLCCAWPCGLAAVYFANAQNNASAYGNSALAWTKHATAKQWRYATILTAPLYRPWQPHRHRLASAGPSIGRHTRRRVARGIGGRLPRGATTAAATTATGGSQIAIYPRSQLVFEADYNPHNYIAKYFFDYISSCSRASTEHLGAPGEGFRNSTSAPK